MEIAGYELRSLFQTTNNNLLLSMGRIEGLWRGGGLEPRGRGGLLTGARRAVRRAGGDAVQPHGAHAGQWPPQREVAGEWASLAP